MIEVVGLTKRYGDVLAVDRLSFQVRPGRVTGFLGPNGAGKSTTMRMILGLDRPTGGRALVDGRPYQQLTRPLLDVGALIDAGALHPSRTGRDHLRVAARSNGIPTARVERVIDQVGLGTAASRRVRGYSLGMRQRLGIAAALLGNPGVLLFDEPTNGLDLDGVRWIRDLVRTLAGEGRTVLVSSHLMTEMQQTADHLVVIGRGRLIADAPIEELLGGRGGARVRVRSSAADQLAAALAQRGVTTERVDDQQVHVEGATTRYVGDLAHELALPVHELTEIRSSLEQAYLELTDSDLEYGGESPAPSGRNATEARR